MRGRGEPATIEEQNLAADTAPRKAVLQTYRMFKPIEIDTSHLDPDAVLEKVLAALYKHGIFEIHQITSFPREIILVDNCSKIPLNVPEQFQEYNLSIIDLC